MSVRPLSTPHHSSIAQRAAREGRILLQPARTYLVRNRRSIAGKRLKRRFRAIFVTAAALQRIWAEPCQGTRSSGKSSVRHFSRRGTKVTLGAILGLEKSSAGMSGFAIRRKGGNHAQMELGAHRSPGQPRGEGAQPGGGWRRRRVRRFARARPLFSAEDNLIPPRERIDRPHRFRSISFHERQVIRTGDRNVRVRKVFRANVKPH